MLKEVQTGDSGEREGLSKIMEGILFMNQSITINNKLTKLVIPSYSYRTNVAFFNLRGFSYLEYLEIGDYCFESTYQMVIEHIPELQSIWIGKHSFYSAGHVMIQGDCHSRVLIRSSRSHEYYSSAGKLVLQLSWFNSHS